MTQMTMIPASQATSKQLDFLNVLRVERGFVAIAGEDWYGVTKARASKLIDEMKELPRPAKKAEGRGLFEGIPLSKYALEEEYEDGTELRFYAVQEYRGTTYIRQLVGAPGDWLRVRMTYPHQVHVVEAIRAQTPLVAAQRYSTEFVCCAVCSSPLSDELSRARGIGPVCWGRFE